MDTNAPGNDAGADHERLRREFLDMEEQLAATNEILAVLGSSAADPDAVLETIVTSARRLCRADVAQIYLVAADIYPLAKSVGLSPDQVEYIARNPLRAEGTLVGRVVRRRRAQQIVDVLADPDYRNRDMQKVIGNRTIMGAPMLLDNDVVGALSVYRTHVDPFDERAMELLTGFAAQAAIAIRNLDLVRALEARSAELSRKVDQLEALSEVGEAVRSSPDLDQVLAMVVTNAVHLSGTDGGSLMEFEDESRQFFVRTVFGTPEDVVERLRRTTIDLDTTLVGRAAIEGRPLEVVDLADGPLDPHLKVLYDAGWRSLLAVPMLREDRIIGALVVRRRAPGGFSDETRELLETFASQSALAILNARLFQELERKSTELEIASRHKSEFLASMSHELRTPLNAVIGFSEVLLDRMFGDINERQEEYLRDIWGSGKHLLELINDILDLSKVEAGRMEIDTSTIAVRDELEAGLSLVRERAVRHAVTLTLDVDPAVTFVQTDGLRFKQVVLNLLTNAVKFTSDGGEVAVRAWLQDEELAVAVTDTGVGVPPAEQERIFESFQQGGRGARKEEGTGLGLTLCRRIVDLLGGRMWLESEVGVGSTFGFVVPVHASVARQVDPLPALGYADGRTALVIKEDGS